MRRKDYEVTYTGRIGWEGDCITSFVDSANSSLFLQSQAVSAVPTLPGCDSSTSRAITRQGLLFHLYFLSSPGDMLIDFTEREKDGEREGKKHPCERET